MRLKNALFVFSVLYLMSPSSKALTWKKIVPQNTVPTIVAANCPANYLPITRAHPDTFRNFCVAKYEMKLSTVTGNIVSQAAGLPVTGRSRNAAVAACRQLGSGYDLISNEQWQTIAKKIAGVKENWSSGIAYQGVVNQGHFDTTPNTTLAASTDNDSCFGTGETCDLSTWNAQRRTHRLPGGDIIWDISGNVWEWVNNNYWTVYGGAFISRLADGKVKNTVGSPIVCDGWNTTPYCGFGWSGGTGITGSFIRGCSYGAGNENCGIFATETYFREDYAGAQWGFRCVYVP